MSNTNTTANTTSSTHLNKTFYDRAVLEGAKTRLVYTKYGQQRSIPLNSGKHVEFRRWNLFDVGSDMCELSEGTTPAGQSLSQTSVEADVKQYGAYVEVSDILEDTAYDHVITDSAQLLGEQLGTVVEWVTREALCSGNNVQRVGGKAARSLITANDKLSVDEIRKAVRTLKKAKARMFSENGRKPHFICVCSPDATYDLQSDTLWQDVSKYAGAEQIYSGEIGKLFGVVFVESTESKILKQSVYTQVASHTAGTANVVVSEITDKAYEYLSKSGARVMIGSTEYAVGSVNKGTKTITLSASIATALSANTKVYSTDAGALDSSSKKGADIHMTLMFGKDAYGVIDLEGRGAMQSIVKHRGSAGSDDPLDQRATVGAKVPAFAAVILNDLWLLRIEHGATA